MERKVIIILVIPFLLFWHWFEPASKKNRAGINAYQAQKYDEALNHFLSAKGIKPDMAELKSNTASALYQMKKYKEALEEFSKIDPEKVEIPKADFYYNLGNSFFRVNQFQKALENYKEGLKLRPDDMDAKKNYELTLQKLKNQQDKKKQKQKQKQQQKKDKKKEKQKPKPKPEKKKDKKKYQSLMKFLNQNEKQQLKKKKRKIAVFKREKDW
ncbi:MAG: tetratricopeptide repeat protein [Candidatus Aminicenantes bacterium]|nr:tetratricopeptide repeat protein [Candidatus Aminicenantes bacterium]NIM79586.1 tetratricopeptide repeat protein [Candidatus Aminicenantes bacterium]NIN18895.1 tetratricopeptide repeat protein [Candidatus Aminicenantes bacterium]NIN42805.1 tetratricopeptide repeat protein [Candidatus Aminicenantes bacterium]NIN85532.1 tetratricopeptide repeat protein [Candidatus Aminicenantes bacterium]